MDEREMGDEDIRARLAEAEKQRDEAVEALEAYLDGEDTTDIEYRARREYDGDQVPEGWSLAKETALRQLVADGVPYHVALLKLSRSH